MSDITQIIEQLDSIAKNPKAQLDKYLSQGKKVIGCMPVYCPEEIVYASGMVPMGIWGTQTEVSKAKYYYPAFICSILQTALELGMKGEYKGLSAIMIPIICDSMKSMQPNWECGVADIPVIPVAQAQNRKLEAGVEFTRSQYRVIQKNLEKISGSAIKDDAIANAVKVYNDHRAAMREFALLAGKHPELISVKARCAVFKSAYFMLKDEHTALVEKLNAALKASPEAAWNGKKVVTTGIIADLPELLDIFEENKIAIAADNIAHESRQYAYDVPVEADPVYGLAKQLAVIEGCSILYDPKKLRGEMVADMVKQTKADGVIYILTKFCDPEEFDYVPMKKLFDKEGIKCVQIEIDQQMTSFEQAKTAIETFCDII